MRKLCNRVAVYLILIVLLAGTIRILRAVQEERYSNDVYLYFQMAENWAHYGKDYVFLYDVENIPPLLPWIMAVGYSLGLSPDYSGLIVGILLGSLMPLGAFWITLNLFPAPQKENEKFLLGGKYAYPLLAAFLVAVHPFFVRISVSCLREILYLPLLTFGVAFALSAIADKSLWKWGIFAMFITLALLARREGIIIIGIFFIWELVEFAVDRKAYLKNISYHLKTMACVLLVFLGIILPVIYSMGDKCTWSPFMIKL